MRLLSPATPAQQAVIDEPFYRAAQTAVLRSQAADAAGIKLAGESVTSYGLAGRLYLSQSGWLLLSVPNALGRGAFDALAEPGAQMPTRDTDDPNAVFNAHITVMSPADVEAAGGPAKITERGHMFHYTLGPVKEITPTTWNGVSRCWAIEAYSPELKALRKSYGLSPLPGSQGDHEFHITFAIRRKKVLHHGEVSKAASYVRVRVPGENNQFLLHHYLNAKTWDHPAGRIEDGEDPRTAAVRELMERTGYEAAPDILEDQGIDGDFQNFQVPYGKLKQVGKPQTEVKLAAKLDPSYCPEHPEECCPQCGARQEQGDNGTCNRCGGDWPEGASAATSGIGKQASGDEMAFKAWKATGLSDEEADRKAGEGLELPGDKPKGSYKERKSYEPVCGHCGQEMVERGYSRDREAGENMWRHGACYDKGPFELPRHPEQDRMDAESAAFLKTWGLDKDAGLREDIAAAAAECEEPKSKEQAIAGNYRHGHCTLQGLPITIETGKGMTRKGTDKNGKAWSITMEHHYGYIKRTESEADGDHIDVFIGPDPESEVVFIVDQYDGEKFDEHKCMLGFTSKESAKEGYLACYAKGWKGCGDITSLTMPQFKTWCEKGKTGKPLAGQKITHKQANLLGHLPALHAPDMYAGAAIGAGLGAATYGIKNIVDPANKKKRSLLSHIGIGGGLGAAGGTLVGDRVRRYVTNNQIPYGYETADHGGKNPLMPRSVSQVYRTAIADKPANDLPAIKAWGTMREFDKDPIFQARREMLRRALGVHPNDPKNDYFRDIGKKTYTSDWRSGGIDGKYKAIEFNPPQFDKIKHTVPDNPDQVYSGGMLTPDDPDSAPNNFWLSSLLARHKMEMPTSNKAHVQDLWDFAPDPVDKRLIGDAVTAVAERGLPALKEQVNTDDVSYMVGRQGMRPGEMARPAETSRADHLKNLVKRVILDSMLTKEKIMFDQEFEIGKGRPQPIFAGQ